MTDFNEAFPATPQTEQQEKIEFESALDQYDTRLNQAYGKALEQIQGDTRAIKFGAKDIPDSAREERLKQLNAKLEEYTLRLRTQWDEKAYHSPEINNLSVSGRYKRDTLRLILEHGEVNTWALGKAYEDADATFNYRKFESACLVIHLYMLDGNANFLGGTGLPKVNA